MPIELMDPKIIKAIIESEPDAISAENEKLAAEIDDKPCPQCGGATQRAINTQKPFKDGEILPNYLLQCLACEASFEPRSGILVTHGNLAKAFVPAIPIIKQSPE